MTVPPGSGPPAGEEPAQPRAVTEMEEAHLTDDEEGSEVSDSEFGLSDRQLEELWGRVADGTWQEDSECHDSPDELEDEKLRGRSSSSSEEAACGERILEGRAASRDPLRIFARQRQEEAAKRAQEAPSLARPVATPQGLGASDRPSPRLRQKRLPPAVASVISSRDMQGTTWYLLRVRECGQERFFLKRYRDFVALDGALRVAHRSGRGGLALPRLPERGLFGLRHSLDIGNFNAKRQQGLQDYVSSLAAQVQRFSEEPALEGFFGAHAPGKARGT